MPANTNTRANFQLIQVATLSAASSNAPVTVFKAVIADLAIDSGIASANSKPSFSNIRVGQSFQAAWVKRRRQKKWTKLTLD